MDTKLEKKEELNCKIDKLSASDIRMLKVFMEGMEAERKVKESEKCSLSEHYG